MGRTPKIEVEETDARPVKSKKECSPELLERLAQMRIKAEQARKEKAKLNAKSKVNKMIKMEQLKKEANELDEIIEKVKEPKVKEPEAEEIKAEEPNIQPKKEEAKPKKKIKKIIYEDDTDEEEEYEEVVVRRRRNDKSRLAPRPQPQYDDEKEIGSLAKQAVTHQLRNKINQERVKYINNLLAPEYY